MAASFRARRVVAPGPLPIFLCLVEPMESFMRFFSVKQILLSFVAVAASLSGGSLLASAQAQPKNSAAAKAPACHNNESGLKLPSGFCATVFADNIGHARHMVVSPSGTVYV